MSNQLKEKSEQGLFILPGGYLTLDGLCHKEVRMRHLTGKEEEIIVGANLQSTIPELLTQVLANCIEYVGPIKEINHDLIRQLLVCDRDYLLLRLRQMTFGDRIDASVQCPNEYCKKQMDIDFDINNVEIERRDIGNGVFFFTLSSLSSYKDKNNAVHSDVEFRLPNISDQEQIAEIYRENQSKALTNLLTRCVKRIGSITTITEELIQSLSMLARREIDLKMQEVSPKVDLQINVQCPECGTKFSSPFDIQNFFLAK